jgi:tetratricopeptide (TPR) repeat protein
MKPNVKLVFCIALLIGVAGCSSWIESSRKMITDEEKKQNKALDKKRSKVMSKWVPRSEYDALRLKHKNLQEKISRLESVTPPESSKFNQIDELAGSIPQSNTKPVASSKAETVDVFGQGGLAQKVESMNQNESGTIVKELKTYKKALALKENGKVDDALRVFQYLERSTFEQVLVRSRMEIGAIYLEKNQFDLSLQVFEKVIATNAFSGKVLEALKGAVISCDGLGLTDKKLRYQSMLKDFFGINS